MNGASVPGWLFELLGIEPLAEGEVGEIAGRAATVTVGGGVLRVGAVVSDAQRQTSGAFGFKWAQRETFESPAFRARTRTWLIERYGDVANADWWTDYGERPVVLDAGCGAGLAALELLGNRLPRVRYIGVDISDAVDVAATRFFE
jgi:arsenite methyltransferase